MAVDIEVKRLDSLARNRASADLKRAHRAQWQRLYEEHLALLRAERAVLGEVRRDRNEPRHRPSPDPNPDGTVVCEWCEEKWPCESNRKTERNRTARRRQPAPR